MSRFVKLGDAEYEFLVAIDSIQSVGLDQSSEHSELYRVCMYVAGIQYTFGDWESRQSALKLKCKFVEQILAAESGRL